MTPLQTEIHGKYPTVINIIEAGDADKVVGEIRRHLAMVLDIVVESDHVDPGIFIRLMDQLDLTESTLSRCKSALIASYRRN